MTADLKPRENVFWIETEKIKPNPMQPRRVFDETSLAHLTASIREYGILQPLLVSRIECEVPGGTAVEYELIAGERRWRAAKMIGLREVPAVVRHEESEKIKLELSIIENVQREDLNPIDRAVAFRRLMDEFNMTQREVALRIGKSRESIANTLRLTNLPEYLRDSIAHGKITEGHSRPLLMLQNRPEEQKKLYEDILVRQLTVRDAERISRGIATERSTKFKREVIDPETLATEEDLGNLFGTRVSIIRERGGKGRIAIEFFSEEEFRGILQRIQSEQNETGKQNFATPHVEVSYASDVEPTEEEFKDFTV